MENQTGQKIKIFRSDNGTECVNGRFQKFLAGQGIKHMRRLCFTHYSKMVAERTNCFIIRKTRYLLQSAVLPRSYWSDACRTAICLKNRSSHRSTIDKTPEEVWIGERPDLSHTKVCMPSSYLLELMYAHIPKQERKMLDAKSKERTFV